MIFYHEGYLYRYLTTLKSDRTLGNKAIFTNQHLYKKRYFKTKIKKLYDMEEYTEIVDCGELPEDTSIVFFVLKKKVTRALYFDSFGEGANTYQLLFRVLKNYEISEDIFLNIIQIFDENILKIEKIDEYNYRLFYQKDIKTVSDKDLVYLLSSGTTKGILLYTLMVASLRYGFDLLIDEFMSAIVTMNH